ncbi:hypothetical protein BDN67DRAFT_909608, partial [Paxillus ammoniavirescens]
TNGKASEHGWANINLAASNTKKIISGAKWDILNNDFSHINYKKKAMIGGFHLCLPPHVNSHPLHPGS